MKRGPMKRCYENAHDLADNDRTCHYAEGYACTHGHPPFDHAWCVDKEGHAVDPTLRHPMRYTYLGIIIPLKTVNQILEDQGHWGILSGALSAKFMKAWAATNKKRR